MAFVKTLRGVLLVLLPALAGCGSTSSAAFGAPTFVKGSQLN